MNGAGCNLPLEITVTTYDIMRRMNLNAKRKKPPILYGLTLLELCFLAELFIACTSTGDAKANGLSLMEAIEQSAEKTAGVLPQGSRVAVVAFESPNNELSEYIIEEFNGAFKDHGIEVVDRQYLKYVLYVLEELNFQMSGYVSDESIRSIGKFIGADIIVTGQLISLGGIYRFRSSAINVETAVRVSINRFEIKSNDQML